MLSGDGARAPLLARTTLAPTRSRLNRVVIEEGTFRLAGDLWHKPSAPAVEGKDEAMFIAMSRFRIARGREAEFEQVWRERDSHLDGVSGFVEFRLLKGPEADDHTLYASHTIWRERGDFEAWTRSEAFRKAHAGAGGQRGLYLGHPEFEGFESVLER